MFGTLSNSLSDLFVFQVTYDNGVTIEKCGFKLDRDQYVYIYMADLIIFYLAPLVLTCILYGLIARILFQSTLPTNLAHKANGVSGGGGSGGCKQKSSVQSSRVQVRAP